MSKLVRTLIAVGLCVALAAPAAAAGNSWPRVEKQTINPPPRTLVDPDACGDYGVEWTINLTGDIYTFFDRQDRRTKVVAHIREDNTVRNTETGLTLRDGPVNFVQTDFYDVNTGLREKIFIIGTSVNVRRGNQRLVDRGPILIDGQTGDIIWSIGPHPARELMDGSFDINLALPAFCDILE
jgi:hypothetical protein